MFYPFILNMWIMRKLTEAQVRAYSPVFITADEAEMILVVPQK